MKLINGTRILLLACACALAWSCAEQDVPEVPPVTFLSQERIAELWESAEYREPVGEPSVQELADSTGTTVVCTQAFTLRRTQPLPPVTLLSCCTGRCKLKPGSTFGDCQTSGCQRSGTSCSALQCSGGCELSQECKPCARSPVIGAIAQ